MKDVSLSSDKQSTITPTAGSGSGGSVGVHDGDDPGVMERLLGGEVRLVDEQEAGDVGRGLALLAPVRPPQRVGDGPGDFIPTSNIQIDVFGTRQGESE